MSFEGIKAGDNVFVVHQKQRHSKAERKMEFVPVSKVGRKYGYVKLYSRDAPFCLTTGYSVHGEHNVRSNGYGFDVFRTEADYHAREKHLQSIEEIRQRLDWQGTAKLCPHQAAAILEILAAATTESKGGE